MIYLHFAAPVVFIFFKFNLSRRHLRGNVGTGSRHIGASALSLDSILHIDDGSIRICQVVDQRRTGF